MEVPFTFLLLNYTWFFKEVVIDMATNWVPWKLLLGKKYFNVFLPLKSKFMSMYFPNLEELSFLLVCAFPNASRISFDWSRTSLTLSILSCWATFVTWDYSSYSFVMKYWVIGCLVGCDILKETNVDIKCI